MQAADTLKCGVRNDLPGFSSTNEAGDHEGFDADFCRVIAAGVLGDSTTVTFVDLENETRFTALQSGEVDVLVRNTTWTASRDGTEGLTFLHPTFYDGQAMMVASDSGYESIDDMDGATVCVTGGTTTEGNVGTEFARRGLTANVQSFDSVALLQEAFVAGRCDGWSSDNSQLNALRSAYPDGPDALTIFPDIFSKEPLTPSVVDGDSRWAQAVNWSIFAAIQAEEYGLTKDERRRRPHQRRSQRGDVPRWRQRRRHRVRPRPRAGAELRLQHRVADRQLRRDLRSQPGADRDRAWRSTHCGPTAACSSPRRTADPGPDRADPKAMTRGAVVVVE